MTDWMDWSECSVTCGNGERVRKRLFTHPMGSEDMCGLNIMETERCQGAQVLCENIDDECAMTGWSDWSPCSVTCGKGIRERRRYYLRQAESETCEREESEQDMCISEVMDCMKVEVAKNFTGMSLAFVHGIFYSDINHSYAELFWRNVEIYWRFPSFVITKVAQVVEIPPLRRQTHAHLLCL